MDQENSKFIQWHELPKEDVKGTIIHRCRRIKHLQSKLNRIDSVLCDLNGQCKRSSDLEGQVGQLDDEIRDLSESLDQAKPMFSKLDWHKMINV